MYDDKLLNNRNSISRRAACRVIAGSIATVSAFVPFQATASEKSKSKKTQFKLNYILASSMYGKTSLKEILPEVSKSGADSIDVWPLVHANQREQIEKMGHQSFRKLLESHKVKLGISTRYDLGPHRLQKEIGFVRKFSGKIIVCGSGKGQGKTLRDQVKSFVKSMQTHVAIAEKNGVTIAIENHANSLIDSFDSLRYLAQYAKSPNLGIALAPYHLKQDEKAIAKLITDLGSKMVHFYGWEHGMGCHKKLPKKQEMMQLPGLGNLDFRPILAAMKKIHYQGWTEIFMHPVPRGIPILPKTAEVTAAINKSRQYLEKGIRNH